MELFKIGFVTVRVVDVIDVSIVTFLLYKLYNRLKGTIALRIAAAVIFVFLLWKLVDLLDMVLLRSVLMQFLGVGAIALIVIFAPEIRRFLLTILKNTFLDRLSRQLSFSGVGKEVAIGKILNAVEDIRGANMGALIVLTGADSLEEIQETGDKINSELSERLLFSVFLPYSPLHDGAVIIDNNMMAAARCILPVSENAELPADLGLRHRAALGLSEVSDSLTIIISEERAEISVAVEGKLHRNLELFVLENYIFKHFGMGLTAAEKKEHTE